MRQSQSPKSAAAFVAGVVASLVGCGQDNRDDETAQSRMVFICTETKEVITGDPQETPAVNPKTGRRTLVPGLYCSRCEKWYPAPPLNVVQREPGSALCPKTGGPLSTDGPVPEKL